MAGSLGELFVELGVFADTRELKDFETKLKKVSKTMRETSDKNDKLQKGLREFIGGLIAIAGAVAGATIALSKLTDSLVSSNQEFLNLTRTSDIALSTFQKWDNVGRMFGVRNAAQQIQNLNERLFELKLTGQGAQGFMLAGINPMGQDAEGIMEQLRNRVSGLDDTSASYLLRQMGLDPTMLHLLRLGKKEFEELGQTVKKYQLTDEQTKQIQQTNVQLQMAQMKLKYLKDRAILAIMPYFIKWMQSLTRVAEMLVKLGKSVGAFLVKWRGLVVVFGTALSRIAPIANIFKSFSKTISSLIIKLPIFGKFLGRIGMIAGRALLPFTMLYLILDDLAVYFQGGKSLIGEVLEWIQNTGSDFSNIFGKMFGGDFFGGLKDLIIKLIDILDDIVQVFLRILTVITGLPLDKWGRNFANFVAGGNYDNLKNYDYGARTPQMTRNTADNRTSYDNRQVNMTNTIHTTQTGETVITELAYAQNYAFSFG